MTRAVFLLSKDPLADHGGDIAMSNLVMSLARECCSVSAIALTRETGPGEPWLTRVPKPAVRPTRLLGRRSLVHRRFDVPALRAAIETTEADVWVAAHSYMAESFLRSGRRAEPLVVDTVNPESSVWRLTRGRLGRIEAPRLDRDELRVALAAQAVGSYDAEEVESYRARGVVSVHWLDVTLAPEPRLDVGAAPPRLVFVGTRGWPPNQEALEIALDLWPRIAAGLPGAELYVVGAPGPRHRERPLPDGVRDLGFVDDLPGLLGGCRALVAPVRTGGGVRVKILDAARSGLPVVGTGPAIGSLAGPLGLTAYDDEEAFVEECRRLLIDPAAATAEGARLHEVNAQRWREGRPHAAVERLLLRLPPLR